MLVSEKNQYVEQCIEYIPICFRNKDIDQGDSITLRCSTWIYMDGYFYYVAEVKAEDKQYLSFEDGLANIIAYMEDNKSLF